MAKKRRLEVRGKPETQPPPPRLLLRVSPERLPRARDRWGVRGGWRQPNHCPSAEISGGFGRLTLKYNKTR